MATNTKKYLAVNIPDLTVLHFSGQPVVALFDGLELEALRQVLEDVRAGGHRVRARLVTRRFLANWQTYPFPEVGDGQKS